nr:MAG TPA: hypothetical protein [Caudoviricetes sp.]
MHFQIDIQIIVFFSLGLIPLNKKYPKYNKSFIWYETK